MQRAAGGGADSALIDFAYEREAISLPACFEKQSFQSSPNCISLIARWSLIKDVRFNERMKYGEDTLYVYEASLRLRSSEQLRVKEPIYWYRQNPDSAMHNVDPLQHAADMLEMATCQKELLPLAQQIGAALEGRDRIGWSVSAYMFSCLRAGVRVDYEELRNRGLYPYPPIWSILKGDGGSARGKLVNWIRFLLGFHPICEAVRVSGVLRRIS